MVRPDAVWVDPDVLDIGSVEFLPQPVVRRFKLTRGRFCSVKRSALLAACLMVPDDLRPTTIVEFDVYQGDSCALKAFAGDPGLLVAVELDAERVLACDTVIAERGLGKRVHGHYDVDQANVVTPRVHDGRLAMLDHMGRPDFSGGAAVGCSVPVSAGDVRPEAA